MAAASDVRVALIAALDRNGAIGRGNRMPWHLPDDLKRFRDLTRSHPVVMGRRTFESIGRPLPDRLNVVVTRRADFGPPGVAVAHSLDAALHACPPGADIFVIGGGEIYRQALPFAGTLYLTHVDTTVEGADAFFPAVDQGEWKAVCGEQHPADARHPHAFRYAIYRRR